MGISETWAELHEGDRLSAAEYNRLTQQVTRLGQMDRGRMRHLNNACGVFTVPEDEHGLLFFNAEATTVPAYGVMLSNGVQAAAGPDFVPKIKKPDVLGCQKNFYVNGPNTVETTAFGEAQWGDGNLYIVAYDSSTGIPGSGDTWGVKSGTYLLQKNYPGFRIEGIYDSTNHWALVRSEPFRQFRGIAVSDIAVGSDGAVTAYYRNATNVYLSLGVNVLACYNDLDVTVKSGATVQCIFDAIATGGSDGWRIIQSSFTC